MRTKVIGKYEAVSLQSVKDNAFEYYIPLASESMTTAELITNRKKFEDQINAWVTQLSSSTNNTEISNISEIISIQTGRMADYDAIILTRTGSATGDGTPPPTTSNKSWLPILVIAAVALYFFTKKKRAA